MRVLLSQMQLLQAVRSMNREISCPGWTVNGWFLVEYLLHKALWVTLCVWKATQIKLSLKMMFNPFQNDSRWFLKGEIYKCELLSLLFVHLVATTNFAGGDWSFCSSCSLFPNLKDKLKRSIWGTLDGKPPAAKTLLKYFHITSSV